MTATNKIKIDYVPLSALHIDPTNVRKIGTAADPIITASIKAIGLQTPLVVRPNKEGFGVVAGSKRYASLIELQKAGEYDADVPVVIQTDLGDAEAIERSLMENVARSEMAPVDEYKAYAKLYDSGIPVDMIAKRFGIDKRRVEQRLALGNLHPDVLQAFADERLNVETIRAFTLIPSQKTQKAIFAQIEAGKIHANGYYIRKAAGADDQSAGKFLALIGEENYTKRGGKVTNDLFGSNHIVSDPALVKTMIDEMLDAKCKELLAAGWKWAVSVEPNDFWRYTRVTSKEEPTKPEAKELKRLKALIEANEQAEDYDQERHEAADAASAAYDALEAAITARGITPQLKAKAGAYVSVNHKGDAIECDFRVEPKADVKSPQAKKAAAKAKLPVEDTISQALLSRLGDTLTSAAAEVSVLFSERSVALAGLIAALTSRDSSAVNIRFASNEYDAKAPSFASALRDALKLSNADQIQTIVDLISKSIALRSYNGAPLDQETNRALAEALDGGRLTKAVRAKFDAGSYFDSVPKTVIAEAVREAMGDEHADKINRMDKGTASKFAAANLPKLKWLPKQLRVKGYDGPAKKVAAKKPAAKTKAKR
jgi:ParB family transcriptional regulator, chromosome partitioning protein